MMPYVIIKQLHLIIKLEDSYHEDRWFHSWTKLVSNTFLLYNDTFIDNSKAACRAQAAFRGKVC